MSSPAAGEVDDDKLCNRDALDDGALDSPPMESAHLGRPPFEYK